MRLQNRGDVGVEDGGRRGGRSVHRARRREGGERSGDERERAKNDGPPRAGPRRFPGWHWLCLSLSSLYGRARLASGRPDSAKNES